MPEVPEAATSEHALGRSGVSPGKGEEEGVCVDIEQTASGVLFCFN